MSRAGAIAALSLTTVLIVGAAVVWSSASHRSAAPTDAARSAPTAGKAATNPGGGANGDTYTLVRQAGGAIRGRDAAALSGYLAKGIDPNSIDADGETLLNKAVLHGTPAMVEMLLSAGADPDLPGEKGLGPLALAALAGHHEMLDRLVEASNKRREAAGLTSFHDIAAEPQRDLAAAPQDAPSNAAKAGSAAATDDSAAADTAAVAAADIAGSGASAKDTSEAPPQADGSADTADQLGQTASLEAAAPHPGSAAVAHVPGDSRAGAYHFAPPPAKAAHADAPHAADGGAATGGAATASIDPASVPPEPANPPRVQAPADAAAPAQADAAGVDTGGAPKNWVLAAQKRLAQLGYYKGTADGVAGPQTSAAVRSYQTVAGIAVDGVVSADLLTRIGASVEAPQPANSAAAYKPPGGGGGAAREETEAQALQNTLNKFQTDLGQNFNSETRPDALRRYCQRNANTWVFDEAVQRSVFCRDLVGLAPR